MTEDIPMTDDSKKWRSLAESELRGRPIDDLNWNTLEGIKVKPVSYTHLTLPTIYSV